MRLGWLPALLLHLLEEPRRVLQLLAQLRGLRRPGENRLGHLRKEGRALGVQERPEGEATTVGLGELDRGAILVGDSLWREGGA